MLFVTVLVEIDYSTPPINQALINQIIQEIKQGNYHRCQAMGITEEILKIIDSLPEATISELVITPVVWAKVTIDENAFMRIIKNNQDKSIQRKLINKAIKLNASNKMLAEYFGLTSNVAAAKRKILETQINKGRAFQLSDNQKRIVWEEWKSFLFLSTQNDLDKIEELKKQIEIAETYQLNLSSVYQEIQTNNIKTSDEQQLVDQLIELNAHQKIINNFFNVSAHKITVSKRFTKPKARLKLFNRCEKDTQDRIIREWDHLTCFQVKNIHDLSLKHLTKLINYSQKYHIEFNSLWEDLTNRLIKPIKLKE